MSLLTVSLNVFVLHFWKTEPTQVQETKGTITDKARVQKQLVAEFYLAHFLYRIINRNIKYNMLIY